jgi:hypothetical protein
MNQRERYFAIAAGISVGLLLLNYVVINPYLEKREKVTIDRNAAQAELTKANLLFERQKKLQAAWKALTEGGSLKNDVGAASFQVQTLLQQWVAESKMNLNSLSEQRRTADDKFVQIGVQCTATGSMAALTRLLWRIERAPVLLRINGIEIKPKKEGVDLLQVTMTISTLSIDPDKDKPVKGDRLERADVGKAGTAIADAGGRR